MIEILKIKLCVILAMFSKGRFDSLLISLVSRLFLLASKATGFVVVNIWTRFVRVQPRRVMFNSFQKVYSCNPKAITEYLIQNHPKEIEIIWVVRHDDDRNDVPTGVKSVVEDTFDFFYYLASSKIIVENTIGLQRMLYRKKICQILYQTWHGSLGIKRLDGAVVNGIKWRGRRWLANKETNYCISNSEFETEVFKSAYWPDVETLLYGHARNDIFFTRYKNNVAPHIDKLKESLGVVGKKTVLIAPSHYDNKISPLYDYKFSEIIEAFNNKFGGEWVVLFRLHPRYKSTEHGKRISNIDGVVNVTSVSDMQDLLLIADAGITDFSSWIFDYLLAFKPSFILHQDKDFINYRRGLYFPFESTPFPLASSINELLLNIESFNSEVYRNKAVRFLEEKGCIDDGEASRRIAEHIISEASDAHS